MDKFIAHIRANVKFLPCKHDGKMTIQMEIGTAIMPEGNIVEVPTLSLEEFYRVNGLDFLID